MDIKNCYKDEISLEGQINLFMDKLETEPCDSSSARFRNNEDLPPFYDEEKFKTGQKFYHKHLFSMLLCELLGLLTIMSTPGILRILTFTRMSSKPLTAYKRYLATTFHTCVWYESDFKPGSELWKSIAVVKNMHNAASKKSCAIGSHPILQRDMGLTQFGFIGYAIIRPELLGFHKTTQKELEGLIHLWRVIGYIIGIDDSKKKNVFPRSEVQVNFYGIEINREVNHYFLGFNICRSSLEETKQLFEALVENIFVPNIRKQNRQYLLMADALIKGMQVMEPTLNTNAYLTYAGRLLNNNLNNNESKIPNIKLTFYERCIVNLLSIVVLLLKYDLIRWFMNMKQRFSFWLLKHFPFIGFLKFGYNNSYVSIYINKNK